MEVTNLKVLKKLMKGDASRKFEFEEDVDLGSFDKSGMLFDFSSSKAKHVATYHHTFGNSHKDRGGSDEEDMAYEKSKSSQDSDDLAIKGADPVYQEVEK